MATKHEFSLYRQRMIEQAAQSTGTDTSEQKECSPPITRMQWIKPEKRHPNSREEWERDIRQFDEWLCDKAKFVSEFEKFRWQMAAMKLQKGARKFLKRRREQRAEAERIKARIKAEADKKRSRMLFPDAKSEQERQKLIFEHKQKEKEKKKDLDRKNAKRQLF